MTTQEKLQEAVDRWHAANKEIAKVQEQMEYSQALIDEAEKARQAVGPEASLVKHSSPMKHY
jgi:response regulator of citrate/malate metabolism